MIFWAGVELMQIVTENLCFFQEKTKKKIYIQKSKIPKRDETKQPTIKNIMAEKAEINWLTYWAINPQTIRHYNNPNITSNNKTLNFEDKDIMKFNKYKIRCP